MELPLGVCSAIWVAVTSVAKDVIAEKNRRIMKARKKDNERKLKARGQHVDNRKKSIEKHVEEIESNMDLKEVDHQETIKCPIGKFEVKTTKRVLIANPDVERKRRERKGKLKVTFVFCMLSSFFIWLYLHVKNWIATTPVEVREAQLSAASDFIVDIVPVILILAVIKVMLQTFRDFSA